MVQRYSLLPGLLLMLSVSIYGVHAQPAPSKGHLVRYFRQMLDNPFYGDRMDGIAGLGHMGSAASGAVPALIQKTTAESVPEFYRLLAYWALARIDAPGVTETIQDALAGESGKEVSGDFNLIAARAAFLAAGKAPNRTLDRYLPALYNHARSGDTSEKILAAWALLEIGTSVTEETALKALDAVSGELDPEHGNYTRHLRYLRLLGPRPGIDAVAGKLEELLVNHEFRLMLVSRKAQTAFTLAVLSYPEVPAALNRYREEVREKLSHSVFNNSALRDALALGPFACTGPIENALAAIDRDPDEEDDEREEARRALKTCRN